MRSFIISLVLLTLPEAALFAQAEPQPPTADEVLKKLQGTWEVLRHEQNGAALAPVVVDALPTVTFQGKDYTWGDGQTGRIVAINANSRPIAIDYLYTSGPRQGDTDFAIIKFEGDKFTDCMPGPGGTRPNQFSSRQGSGRTLITYQRTTQQRGPGSLLNPWFYLGVCVALVVGFAGLLVVLLIVVLWLVHRRR